MTARKNPASEPQPREVRVDRDRGTADPAVQPRPAKSWPWRSCSMTALATASLAVVAWIIARIAFASVYVAGSRSTVTRTGLVRIAVRPGG